MKTLTEFSGFVLKDALSKKAALLAEGKTEEEAQAAIHEQLKLDEGKIPFYRNAIDMTQSRLDRVKRVVVAVKATETEKVPESFMEREGHFYLVEFFPQADGRSAGKGRNDRDGDRGYGRGGGRGDSRGGRGNDRGNSRGRPESREQREPREPREPREARPQPAPNPNAAPFISTGLGTLAPKPAGAARPPRGERKPRPPQNKVPGARGPRGPKGAGELRLVLKGQSTTTLQGSGVAETPASVQAPAESTTDSASASTATQS